MLSDSVRVFIGIALDSVTARTVKSPVPSGRARLFLRRMRDPVLYGGLHNYLRQAQKVNLTASPEPRDRCGKFRWRIPSPRRPRCKEERLTLAVRSCVRGGHGEEISSILGSLHK